MHDDRRRSAIGATALLSLCVPPLRALAVNRARVIFLLGGKGELPPSAQGPGRLGFASLGSRRGVPNFRSLRSLQAG